MSGERPPLWRHLVTAAAVVLALLAQYRAQRTPFAAAPWMYYTGAACLIAVAACRRRREGSAVIPVSLRPVWGLRRGLCAVMALGLATLVAPLSEPGWRALAALALWMIALALAVIAARDWHVSPGRQARRTLSSAERFAIASILVVALLARLAWLDTLPRYYFGDESRLGVSLLRMARDGIPDLFNIGWNTWPVLGIILQGILTPLFGLHVAALRLSSALVGTLTVLATYLLARQLFTARAALFAAALLAIGRTAIDFSRLGICHAQVACFEAFAFFFWWKAIDTGKAGFYLWSGIAAGLCLYTYNAGQLVPLFLLGWMVASCVLRPRSVPAYWRGGAVALLGLVLTVLPLLFTVTDELHFGPTWNEWTYMARNRQTVAQAVAAWRAGGIAPAAAFVGQQAANTWLGFTVIPANAYGLGYRGGGMLDHVSGPLFVLGLGLCVSRLLRARELFVVLWWLVTAIVGGVMTDNPPAFVRLVGLLPALAILAALPLDWLLQTAGTVAWRRVVGTCLAGALLTGAAWDNWRTYFVAFPRETADETSEMVHLIRRLPPEADVLLVGAEHFLRFNDEIFTLEFPGRNLESTAEPGQLFPLHRPVRSAVAMILGPTQATLADYARTLYPNLQQTDVVRPGDGALLFRALVIPEQDVRAQMSLQPAALGGLTAVYQRDGQEILRSAAPQLNEFAVEAVLRESVRLVVEMPFTATWEGALRIDRAGAYEFEAVGSGPYTIVLDNQPLFYEENIVPEEPRVARATRELAVGLHSLHAHWDSTKPAHTTRRIFQLYWTPPGGQKTLIPPDSFAPAAAGGHRSPVQ